MCVCVRFQKNLSSLNLTMPNSWWLAGLMIEWHTLCLAHCLELAKSGMQNILHKFTLDSMHQIDPKESDNPGREGEVGCWESWHCWSISMETILWQCCHFITKSVCDSYSGKTPRNWRLQEESTRYFRWSSDRLKWQHRENEGVKDQVKNLQQHLGLLELRHTALAHYIVGIWNIWKNI